MRIAVISDIHGNLVALDAVLDDLVDEEVDEIVCLGDVALRGPQPCECLQRIRELGCPVVMGNTDEWLLDDAPTWLRPDEHNPIMEIDLWCAAQLTADDRAFLHSFQPTVDMQLSQTDGVCCYHGSPRHNAENILPITTEADLDEMIEGCQATVLVGGHTHIQMFRRKYEKTILNVGSVGLPFLVNRIDGDELPYSAVAPWAEYAIIDHQTGWVSVDMRRVLVDLDALEWSAHASGMPHAQWWMSYRDRSLTTSMP